MEYKVESTELTDIADAIREKSGSQDALTFPNEFISGIRSIPTGSTSVIADEYDATSTYAVGDYVVYDNTLYKCNTAITTAEAWTSAHWDEVTVMEEVETKADTDGMYEDMSVGNLISTQFVENKEPYLFRRTGNGKDIDGSEKAFIDKIIGGTVAWNQLVQNGNFESTSRWTMNASATISVSNNVATITPSTSANSGIRQFIGTFLADHVYAFIADLKTNGTDIYRCGFAMNSSPYSWIFLLETSLTSEWQHITGIYKRTADVDTRLVMYTKSADSSSADAKNVMAIDLTQMFGTEVANYVYSLEQTTSGAGVAWLRNHGFIDGSYRAYDSGSLQSVKTSEHRTVGFNQWDEEWEVGGIDQNTGAKISASNQIRSKNYIRLLPTTNYCITRPANSVHGIAFYDSSKGFIEYKNLSVSGGSTVIETPSNSMFAMFRTFTAYGTTYNHDICINISDPSKNGQYEPYESHSYPLDSDLELRGIPKLSNGSLYYDGDVYESSGAVSRKYGIVDLGTLDWTSTGTNPYFYTTISDAPTDLTTDISDTFICSKYVYGKIINSTTDDKICCFTSNGQFRVRDTDYSDAATFKTAMSGVYLVYELATPTTETADPYANPQIVNPLGTEEYIDTRDVPVPVGHETKYMANLKAKIEGLPWDLSMIAPIENGTTASKAYSTGQYFLKDNQFCKALTSIASGATFTLNTNYAVTTVADELYSALHS